MILSIVSALKNIFLRHKGVKTFKYQSAIYNNAQNNYSTYQVYLDDVALHQINITTNIVRAEYQIYILSQPQQSGKTVADIQDEAYTIAVDVMALLDDEWQGIISVHDWSILTVSNLTDDNSAGVKLSLVLRLPNPLNLCEYKDNFNDEPYEPEPDKDIDIDIDETGEITIKKIKLPKTKTIC